MSLKGAKDQEPIPYQALLDENRALKDEIQNLRALLDEADELRRAISEGELESKRAEEWTAYLASHPELNPNPIFEVGSDGMVGYANLAAKQIFPDLAARGIDHPIIGGFREIVDWFKKGKLSLVRDVKFNDKYYQQAIHFVSDRKIFRFYNLDITKRKQTEETLAFERSQLLSIFDGMDDVVYVTDPYTHEVLYANKAMKEKFGGELVGGICYREFQRRDSPCDFCTNPIILKERDKLYQWEYYNSTVDRYFMIMDRIIKWPDGRDVRLEIAKDITERKRSEEALRISEEKYRSLFNSIDEGFNIIEIIFDDSGKAVDHRILDANPSQEKMTGLKDVVGKRARELLPNFEDYWIESFSQVAITGEPVRLENRIEGLDRWFDVYASRFGGEGSRKVAVVFNDITQRKRAEEALHQSEERLNFALETIRTGAWDLDLVNHDSPHRSLEHDRIFGYEQLLPKWTYEMFLNHVLPEDRAMVDEKFQKAISSGGDWSFECRIRRVDGVIRWIWAAGRHQVDSTGSIR